MGVVTTSTGGPDYTVYYALLVVTSTRRSSGLEVGLRVPRGHLSKFRVSSAGEAHRNRGLGRARIWLRGEFRIPKPGW